jgi:hypothetical protein
VPARVMHMRTVAAGSPPPPRCVVGLRMPLQTGGLFRLGHR